MDFIEYNNWGVLGQVAIFGPAVIGTMYYILKAIIVLSVRRRVFHPMYDPMPMRIWYTASILVAAMGLGGSYMTGDLLILPGTLLLAVFMFFVHEDFRSIF